MIKAVLFDMDGTLLESESQWLMLPLRLLCAKNQYIPPELLRQCAQAVQFREQLQFLLANENIHLDMTLPECEAWCLQELTRMYAQIVPAKEGAGALLQALKERGIPMALVTATVESCALAAFDRLGLSKYFDKRFCGLWTGARSKGNPAVFAEIADEMGVKPHECLVVDDALYAIKAAKAAGMHTWGIADGIRFAEKDEILQTAERYFERLPDLQAALMGLI